MRGARVVVAAAILLSPSACEFDRIFPPNTSYSPSASSRAASNPGYHIVQPGDSLSSVADRYGLTAQEIADANTMQPPYVIHRGQYLILPRPPVHEVRRGETMYRISRQYALNLETLADANGIGPPYTIYPGQQLFIPQSSEMAAVSPPDSELPAAEAAPAPTAESAGQVVTTLLPDPAPATTAAVDGHASSTLPPPPPALLTPNDRSSQLPAAALPPPTTKSGFIWPVRGEVLSTFGPSPGGLHNDGINIAAPRGTPIVAAQSGVVIFVGEEIEGFGKLLIIRHAGGWSTAYGHNDVILVSRGDKVGRGAVIARVGSTGDVPSPQLHFEIRRQTKAVNPIDHLA